MAEQQHRPGCLCETCANKATQTAIKEVQKDLNKETDKKEKKEETK